VANRAPVGPEPILPVTYSLVKNQSKSRIKSQVLLNWNGSFRCEQTKKFVTRYDAKITEKLLNLNKNDIRIAVGIITGHAKIYYHLNKMGLRDDPDCRICGRGSETFSHLIVECENLREIRNRVFNMGTNWPEETPDIYKIINYFHRACDSFPSLKAVFDR
jgi:hypothetical protein